MNRIAMTLTALLLSGRPTLAGNTVTYIMTIDGAQETPSVTDSPAFGSGTATLDLDTNMFSWDISYQDLTGPLIAAHFHGPAPRCEPAVIEVTISNGGPATGTLIGAAAISALQAADFLAGQWYVNLHTALHGGGEIRGQGHARRAGRPVAGGRPRHRARRAADRR